MLYKNAYQHLLRRLFKLIGELERSQHSTPADISVQLRQICSEAEMLRMSSNPYPSHRAPRSGSSLK